MPLGLSAPSRFGAALCVLLAACESAPATPDAAVVDAHLAHDAVHDAPLDAHDGSLDAHASLPDRPAADRADASENRCPGGTPLPYPAGDEVDLDLPLPDLRLATATTPLQLSRYYTPCAARPRLLVLRVQAAWSGPSRFHAAHTARLRALPEADRLDVVDLLVLGATNAPAVPSDLPAWNALYDRPPDAVALDPDYRLRPLFLTTGRLPLVVLVDPRTMRILHADDVPEGAALAWNIASAVATLDGLPRPAAPTIPRIDDRLQPDQWAMVQAMTPVPPPPPDPTNRWADDPAAARFGATLFLDSNLSRRGDTSCSACHRLEQDFTDGRPRAVGTVEGDRNTPTVLLASHNRWQFWDGRADSLWAQALGPIENELEMDSTRLRAVRYVAQRYAAEYRALFGPAPDFTGLPADGRPGDPAYDALPAATRAGIDRMFVNVGKAIAAYERTLRPRRTRLDAYAEGNFEAMSPLARTGLRLFFNSGCIQCHWGPTLSNDSFHNLQFASGRRDGRSDPGRRDAIDRLLASPFNARGAFSDAPDRASHLADLRPLPAMEGQFHTTTLRDISRTGPWGHGGTFPTMAEVMLHYAEITLRPPPPTASGTRDFHLGSFHMDEDTINALVALMDAMSTPAP